MQITRAVLDEAAAKGLIRKEQSVALWNFLVEHELYGLPHIARQK
jgi:hypothetical protein